MGPSHRSRHTPPRTGAGRGGSRAFPGGSAARPGGPESPPWSPATGFSPSPCGGAVETVPSPHPRLSPAAGLPVPRLRARPRGVPPPPALLTRPRAAPSPVAPPAGPTPRACPPPALPRSTAAIIGGPSHTAQILPTDSPSTALPPPCVGGAPTPTLDPTAQPASPCSPSDTVLFAAASRSPQTTYAAFAAGSLCSAAIAYNARRRAIAPAVGHARVSSLPSAGPPTAALPPKPPAPSALSPQLPAPALAALETAGHSPITYRLSVTRVCPPLGLVSKKNITSCHAPEPPPPTLRYARSQ